MSLTIINNPFDVVLKAATELYPGLCADIQFNPNLNPKRFLWFKWGACGETIFPDDGSTPIVNISANIPVYAAVEILAHELAHVATPWDDNHGKAWQDAFNGIGEKYEELSRMQKEKWYKSRYPEGEQHTP